MACYDPNTLTASGSGELSVNLRAEGGLVADVNGIYLNAPVSFLARRTTDQSIPTGVGTKVQFATESFDRGSDFDAVTNFIFTAPYTGIYHFDAQISVDASGNTVWCMLYKNATLVAKEVRWNNTAGDDMSANVSITIDMNAADTMEVQALHDAGSNRNVLGSGVATNYFSGFLVGRT